MGVLNPELVDSFYDLLDKSIRRVVELSGETKLTPDCIFIVDEIGFTLNMTRSASKIPLRERSPPVSPSKSNSPARKKLFVAPAAEQRSRLLRHRRRCLRPSSSAWRASQCRRTTSSRGSATDTDQTAIKTNLVQFAKKEMASEIKEEDTIGTRRLCKQGGGDGEPRHRPRPLLVKFRTTHAKKEFTSG